jgi:hypothetical protein
MVYILYYQCNIVLKLISLNLLYKYCNISWNRVTVFTKILRDYYMTFSISPWYQPETPISSPTVKLDCWYQERYGIFHVIIYLSHILHIAPLASSNSSYIDFFQALTFILQKRSQTMLICTMTLKSVYKFYPRRWHLNGNSYSTRHIYLRKLFRFKLFKLYSNILKCVNLI